MKIDEESMRFERWYFSKFLHFHNSSFTPPFILFRKLDRHLMHLISWKNFVINTFLSFYDFWNTYTPYLSMNKKHETISLINISSEYD